jgi:MEMO1 family protein
MLSESSAVLPAFRRGLEAIEIEHEGKPMILLRDHEGLLAQPLAITPAAFFIAMMLNGQTRADEISQVLSKSTGQLVSTDQIHNVIREFEKMELIETPAVQEKRRQVVVDFINNPVRPAYLKNTAYPEGMLDLAVQFGKYFNDPSGPGKQAATSPSRLMSALGVVSPHIDFHRGGPAYAWTYQALSECPPPDIVVALGVAHMSPNSPWVMTPKAFETPYGPLAANEDVYKEIAASLWYNVREEEAVFRTEHSLEFQAVWLKYLWRDKAPAWVPILCSSFDRFCDTRAPSSIATIEDALQKIGASLLKRHQSGQRVMILAGVDMAHVGARFGDEMEMTSDIRAKIEKEDRDSINHLLSRDADAFYLSVVKDNHWRKWCGLSALYTSIRLINILAQGKPVESSLLTYAQAEDPVGGVVSFAGMIYQ